jgi:hypothetical protein
MRQFAAPQTLPQAKYCDHLTKVKRRHFLAEKLLLSLALPLGALIVVSKWKIMASIFAEYQNQKLSFHAHLL